MSEITMVQIFIVTVSLLGPLVGSFILCRKYRRICDTFSYDEEKAKVFHTRVQVYQLIVLSCFVYGLMEGLSLRQQYGAVPYTAVIAGIVACVLNCVAGVIQGVAAAHYVTAEIITNQTVFSRGIIRMGLIEMIPVTGLILYMIGLYI
ncbi:MAG: hypothetical protein PHQ72_04195 [Hespellia sp.]|nr:hypothetical protein [Hespellia sp.]